MNFDTLKSAVAADWQALSKWREAAEDEYAFRDGHQWTEEEKASLEENARVPVVFNRVQVILAAVSGSEINNRTEVRFIPREIGDAKPNEILTAGAEWFRDESNAEDEETQAFDDMLVSGIGFTETLLDYTADVEGAPRVVRIDPLEMCWDRHAHRKGLQDASRYARVRKIPIDEALDMFPGKTAEQVNADWIDKVADEGERHLNLIGDQYKSGNAEVGDNNRGTVTVVQVQWREKVKAVEYVDPQDGQRKEMPQGEWDKLAKVMPVDTVIPNRKMTKYVWKQAFLGQSEILMENQPCKDGSTFKAMTGHWDRKDKRFYGLLRVMMDPQKFANKWLSQTLHIINSNAKGGVMYEQSAVIDARAFEDGWAAADSALAVKDGALTSGRIQPKPQVQMPAALMQLTQFAIGTIRDTSGVSLELMGMADRQQAGVLEYQRRQSSMTTLATYFDSLRFYRKCQGEVILSFLRDFIAPTGRLVRIVREGLQEYVSLATELGTRKYDVIVDDSPAAPNQKERAWAVIEKMMPVLQGAGLSLEDWADVLDYSPLPSSFAEKVRAKAEEQKKSQGQDPMEQLAAQAAQAEVQKTMSEAEENASQTELNRVKAQREAVAPIQPIAPLGF
ncbi:MAG: phage portal protein [Synechococcaceae cyanobacterium SM1_2_3]|nr:phage portal protein [Synechococcaceae cyanobacterium SM1_2_3]